MSDPGKLAAVIQGFATDRLSAHEVLFRRRHPDKSPAAHRDLIRHLYSPRSRLLVEAFRGFGKSTYLEECAIVRALFREFHNMVIVGSSYARACDRLAAIKNELEINDALIGLFGEQRTADTAWREGRIVLRNGVCIQAMGRDQSMLGIKHLDWRPDAALIDDVEDPEEVRTDAEREQTWGWFIKTFLPSLDHPLNSWIRVLGTRRGSGSLPERLERDGWPLARYPIEHINRGGDRAATWPAKFPLPIIDRMRETYRGDMHTWAQEYMCQAVAEQARVFQRADLKCDPRPRATFDATYAMYDPARTTGRSAATTGKAVWSWKGPRLVFWRVSAEQWLPDQIIDDMFQTHREFDCTWVGFEEDGLNEWAKQPIRTEALRRRVMLPLLPVRAPRGKTQFIQGLQPYMHAGEVSFAGQAEEFKDAIDQFLSFPRGKIDAPNACAYALLLRPGSPVYDGFSDENVAQDCNPVAGSPLYLAGNADGSLVTAALVQRVEGEIIILADWVREGSPAEIVGDIMDEAALAYDVSSWRTRTISSDALKAPVVQSILTRLPINWIVPAWHRETYRNVGLLQAIRALPAGVSTAEGGEDRGRQVIAGLIQQRRHGRSQLTVSAQARWTARGFAGGYARELGNRGYAAAQPDSGVYRLLMEGLESFAAVGARVERDAAAVSGEQPVAYDRRGNPYQSAMPARK